MKPLWRASLLCLAFLTACGGGGSPNNDAALSGNWQITLQNTTSTENESGFLLQSGPTLLGGLQLSGETISGQAVCAGVGSVQGQASGPNVALTITQAGRTVNLTGIADSNFASMNGNYSILAAGCGETEVGTWAATAVKPLTGSLQLTFTSGESAAVFHFTGTITQGTNTGQSTATISGTMSSKDAPCPPEANIAGVVSGTSVVFNFLDIAGDALGKFQGTISPDATSISGYYRFSNATGGKCTDLGGAAGTITPSSGT